VAIENYSDALIVRHYSPQNRIHSPEGLAEIFRTTWGAIQDAAGETVLTNGGDFIEVTAANPIFLFCRGRESLWLSVPLRVSLGLNRFPAVHDCRPPLAFEHVVAGVAQRHFVFLAIASSCVSRLDVVVR
jgi:hypothetical protein